MKDAQHGEVGGHTGYFLFVIRSAVMVCTVKIIAVIMLDDDVD